MRMSVIKQEVVGTWVDAKKSAADVKVSTLNLSDFMRLATASREDSSSSISEIRNFLDNTTSRSTSTTRARKRICSSHEDG